MPPTTPPALYWPTLLCQGNAPPPTTRTGAAPLVVLVQTEWHATWLRAMAQAGVDWPTIRVANDAQLPALVDALANADVAVLVPGPLADAACAAGLPVWLLDSPLANQAAAPTVHPCPLPANDEASWHTLVQQLSSLPAQPDETTQSQLEQGRLALEAADVPTACALLWALWRAQPHLARAAAALAVCAHRTGLTRQAVALGLRACRLNPQDAESHSNLGAFLKQLGQVETARSYQQRAVDMAPHSAQAHSNLGNTLGALGQWEQAVAHAQRATALAPQAAEYHYNLGVALRELARFDEALVAFRRAQSLAGRHLKAELHIALTELLTGDMPAGWQHYDCRWEQADAKEKRRNFDVPEWRGESLQGKTILVHAEQGFGDSFQFLRYVPLLAQDGAHVILVVQPEVHALAARLNGVGTLVASGAPLPPFDVHAPLLGLPAAFGTTLETIPASVPYLSAAPERVAHWQKRLGPPRAYRVALVWAGRPTHGNDANRSLPLQVLNPLLAQENIEFFALQKGAATAQVQSLPTTLQPQVLDAEIRDFEDTAAILTCMDELVTVDTSVAHLAGALAVRTRVLLPQVPDWRWLVDRSDSPWYPQTTLYRQLQRGVWGAPVARLVQDIRTASTHATL